jgi:hypothetical protein
MSVNKPPIRDKRDIYRDVSAKDLSRKEFLSYIFGDFARAFYIVGCIFLDGLIIGEAYSYVPGFFSVNSTIERYFPNSSILLIYTVILILFSESLALFYEIKYYKKRWS